MLRLPVASLLNLRQFSARSHISVAFSKASAECFVYLMSNLATVFAYAGCYREVLLYVGFIMMGYYEEKKYYTLWKLMIDRRHQGRGYGKAALELGIAFLKERFRAKEIYTGVIPGNSTAKSLYRSVGFEDTGLFENGMEEMRLRC